MFFTEKVKPRLSDFGPDGRLSYEAILQMLETTASHHADFADDSVIENSQGGTAWIFVDWRVALSRRPENDGELLVTTWARARTAASAVFRDFTVADGRGQEVLRAEAKFALLNTGTGRLSRITDELYSAYRPEEKNVFADSPTERLRPPAAYEREFPLALRRADIDYNGHVHNTRYLEFALEALPKEALAGEGLKEMRVVFSRPVTRADTPVVRYAADGDTHIVGLYAEDALCTLIALKE